MSTSAQLPLCVYCGNERPADQSRCLTCGKTWIDIRVGASQEIPIAAAVGAGITSAGGGLLPAPPPQSVVETDTDVDAYFDDWDPWATPPARRRDRMRWLIPGVLAVAVVVVYGLIFFGFLDSADEPGPTSTAPAEPTTTVAPSAAAGAPATTAVPTTTAAPSTTTTTTTIPAPTSFAALGDPIPLNLLPLRSAAIGPIELGMSAEEATGMFTASLGTADESGAADAGLGLCETETGFWLRWAELTVVFSGTPESGTFSSYRYAVPNGPATSHIDLATPSGIHLGDSVTDLESTYDQYTIAYIDIDGADHFTLSEGDELLLWGPITSTEPGGRVRGIYSPESCA